MWTRPHVRHELLSGANELEETLLHDILVNFTTNLFKPLLLFFYLGFLIPLLKVDFELPYPVYQGLTIYLLLAIGWHGGEELANIQRGDIHTIVGFMVMGFLLNFVIGLLAYGLLSRIRAMRRVDRATVAGHYGSDSAGTFAACVAFLTTAGIAFNAYMPAFLAVMEIPGCLLALMLVARLRKAGMDTSGILPDEFGYTPSAIAGAVAPTPAGAAFLGHEHIPVPTGPVEVEPVPPAVADDAAAGKRTSKLALFSREQLREVFLSTGLYLLLGGLLIGLAAGLQGPKVVESYSHFFVAPFQGALALFLLEMGITASRKLADLKSAGRGLIVFGLLAPNLFAVIGILAAYSYATVTGSHFDPGTYVLFAVLCGSASYIAVPAVQQMAIPEASATLPLAASLGLTFTYNVTIGIPLYVEFARIIGQWFPGVG